jgi:anti-sigma regulatory factor (Ser/Thr protein kinase)
MKPKQRILALLARRRSATGGELAAHLRLSRQALSLHLRSLLADHKIVKSGSTRGASYMLASRAAQPITLTRSLAIKGCDEDRVWDEVDARLQLTRVLRPNVLAVMRYAFTEMLNNAIEHSQSDRSIIRVVIGPTVVSFEIRDYGIGAFHSIASKLHLPDEETALVELLKGKTTTMPEAHTGEGIFFTSRVGDTFSLKSHRIQIEWNRAKEDVFVSHPRFARGTLIQFSLQRSARQTLEEVFNEFASQEYDFQFQKTTVSVRLLQPDYVSRSEARRLLANLEKFREIVVDFRDVRSVGQGFADEVFRVFADRNPGIVLRVENSNPAVMAMIRHVSREVAAGTGNTG